MKELHRYAKIFLGILLITTAYAFITVPQGIINGGVTSLSMSLALVLPGSVGLYTTVITLLLMAACWRFLGREYFRGSLFFTVFYLLIFNGLCLIPWALPIPWWAAVLLAGAMLGTGVALCVTADATTVGADTLALILHQKWPKFPMAAYQYAINIVVMLAGLATYGLRSFGMGVLFCGIQNLTMELMLRLLKKKKAAPAA